MIPLSEPSLGGRELEYITRCLDTRWISIGFDWSAWKAESCVLRSRSNSPVAPGAVILRCVR